MMVNRIEKRVLSGVILLLMAPFLLVGALLVILVAGFFGVPLTSSSSPKLFRKREALPAPAASRDVGKATHRLLDSAPFSAR